MLRGKLNGGVGRSTIATNLAGELARANNGALSTEEKL